MKIDSLCAFSTAIALVLLSPVAGATLVTLNPTDDAYVNNDQPDSNFGNEFAIVSSIRFNSADSFGYLKFDLGSIPVNETIVSATLNLYQQGGVQPGVPGDVNLFRMTDDTWNENTVTWNTLPATTTPGNYLGNNANGGSYVGWSQWNLFESGLWDPASDLSDGFLSLALSETGLGGDQAHGWCSKDATPFLGNCNADNPFPYLTITTQSINTVPTPPTLFLFGYGLVGIALVRIKRGPPTIVRDSETYHAKLES